MRRAFEDGFIGATRAHVEEVEHIVRAHDHETRRDREAWERIADQDAELRKLRAQAAEAQSKLRAQAAGEDELRKRVILQGRKIARLEAEIASARRQRPLAASASSDAAYVSELETEVVTLREKLAKANGVNSGDVAARGNIGTYGSRVPEPANVHRSGRVG